MLESLDRMRSIPGIRLLVRLASLVLGGSERIAAVSADGQADSERPEQRDPGADQRDQRLDISKRSACSCFAGADFDASDAAGAERVAIVSRSLAAAAVARRRSDRQAARGDGNGTYG